ncbi:MAG: hypothetical protein Q9210_001400 [Variospora velana]
MPRPSAGDYAEDVPRRPTPRKGYEEDFGDEDEESQYEEEERPRRGKGPVRSKPKRVQESEEEEEEEEVDDDARGKQVVIRKATKKPKSSGKEIVRRKKQESTTEEDSSDESEKELKKKAKKKTKARKAEVITKKAWEPVPRDEVDRNFINLVADELGQNKAKIMEGIEDDMLQRHTETGEYNMDAFFDTGFFSKKDQKNWQRCVEKLKGNKQKSRILFCSAKTESLGGGLGACYGPSYGPIHAAPGYCPSYGPSYGPSRTHMTSTHNHGQDAMLYWALADLLALDISGQAPQNSVLSDSDTIIHRRDGTILGAYDDWWKYDELRQLKVNLTTTKSILEASGRPKFPA